MTTGAATPRLATTANTTVARTVVEELPPAEDAMAAPPDTTSKRFLGFTSASRTESPAAFTGVKSSSAAIHLGAGGSWPSAGRPRQLRTLRNSSNAPRTILTTDNQVAGASSVVADGSARRATTPVRR